MLHRNDWKGIARMIMDYEKDCWTLKAFRGGTITKALSEYATEDPHDDDVYTTGTSFTEYCNEHYRTKSFDYNPKWVAFARSKPKDRSGIKALFTMPEVQDD